MLPPMPTPMPSRPDTGVPEAPSISGPVVPGAATRPNRIGSVLGVHCDQVTFFGKENAPRGNDINRFRLNTDAAGDCPDVHVCC